LIVVISIPLSILFSLTVLSWLGETINIMTLGGLALAVGMLVDQGIVTLESIFYHLQQGKDIEPAILDGAQQIIVPAFVTLLVLNIVFVPMYNLSGVAGYLFSPLAESAVFSLLASFVLSFTLVPTMAKYMLGGAVTHGRVGHGTEVHSQSTSPRRSRNPFKRFQEGFAHRFMRFREGYRSEWRAAARFLHRGAFKFAA
jgi:multidrug efflux pump subunit AcrB